MLSLQHFCKFTVDMHFCTYFFSICSRFCGTYLLTKSKSLPSHCRIA
nr:MAG TPA: hypothetical protein [Caudoviricetes sp.]